MESKGLCIGAPVPAACPLQTPGISVFYSSLHRRGKNYCANPLRGLEKTGAKTQPPLGEGSIRSSQQKMVGKELG